MHKSNFINVKQFHANLKDGKAVKILLKISKTEKFFDRKNIPCNISMAWVIEEWSSGIDGQSDGHIFARFDRSLFGS